MRLPDGTELAGTGSGSGWALGYNRRLTYPAIPAGVNDATLAFPCLQQTAVSAFPESWEIPLHFVVAPPDQTVYPVVDLPTPTAAPAAENNATANTAPASQEPEGKLLTPVDISLSFDRLVPMEDGTILYGSLQPAGEDIAIGMVDSSALHLVDAGGQEIALEEDTDLGTYFLTWRHHLPAGVPDDRHSRARPRHVHDRFHLGGPEGASRLCLRPGRRPAAGPDLAVECGCGSRRAHPAGGLRHVESLGQRVVLHL